MSKQGQNVPEHIGLILDGNRRWAKSKGLPTLEGHRRGAKVLREISKVFFDRGVKVLSAYVFSTENWNRSPQEINYLMKLIIELFKQYSKQAAKENIRIVVLGRQDGLSPKVVDALQKAQQDTADNDGGILALCLNYGGRQEIIDAFKEASKQGIKPEDLDAESFDKYLYSGGLIGDVDLVVRTSGEQRLSNFMTWRSTYSELLFIDKFWPDVQEQDVDQILEEYARRQRRYGK